jgi:hypothetical protein
LISRLLRSGTVARRWGGRIDASARPQGRSGGGGTRASRGSRARYCDSKRHRTHPNAAN